MLKILFKILLFLLLLPIWAIVEVTTGLLQFIADCADSETELRHMNNRTDE